MIAFICCSATSGSWLKVSILGELAPVAGTGATGWAVRRRTGPVVAVSSTRGDAAAGRSSYASPVMGLGAHLIAALETGTPVTPHLMVGGGGNAVFTRSPFARDDLDPVAYWGLGVTWWLSDRLAVRVDA